MLITPGLALYFAAFKLGAGCVIGLFTALVCYRSRITNGLLLRGALFDVATWGEDIVKHEAVICIFSSCIAGLLAGIRFSPHTRTPAP